MSAPALPQLVDLVITRRKDRLRVLYAAFLAREATGGSAVKAAAIQRRVGLTEERFSAAVAHLEAGGLVATSEDRAIEVLHAGVVAIEQAIVRVDRESGEFPALRSILGVDLQLPRKPED